MSGGSSLLPDMQSVGETLFKLPATGLEWLASLWPLKACKSKFWRKFWRITETLILGTIYLFLILQLSIVEAKVLICQMLITYRDLGLKLEHVWLLMGFFIAIFVCINGTLAESFRARCTKKKIPKKSKKWVNAIRLWTTVYIWIVSFLVSTVFEGHPKSIVIVMQLILLLPLPTHLALCHYSDNGSSVVFLWNNGELILDTLCDLEEGEKSYV
ncbi:hypothetical protein CHS0354_025331 [Potamilus streckersoni]|uniref:Uncharacterized protein n=1 Tax=Potamilus streckersoni TaxID=2493646 RepID=A0AAE0VZM8_9BIVA|nr:hypothetical protein CHS0354_025331 [Potamilus streckersoni]